MKIVICMLFISTLFQYSSAAQHVLGIVPEKASLFDPNKPFVCLDGSMSIPFDHVNDDYCDCRDGSDEPGTSACLNGQFACENLGYVVQTIPSSRVNDGICDCCDGSDETGTEGNICANTCNKLAAQMHEEQERIRLLTEQGMIKKKELIEEGNLLKKSIQNSIDELQANRINLETEKNRLEELKKEAEAKSNTAKAAQDLIFEQQKAELELTEKNKKSHELFRFLDLNKDTFLTPEELVNHVELDILFNNDGVFSLDESNKLLDENEKVSVELFTSMYYDKISPHLNEETQITEADEYDETSEENRDEDEPVTVEDTENKINVKPTYDDETQKLIDEFNALRTQFEEADRKFQSADREIKEKEAQLKHDVGPENEFAAMMNKCFEFNDREYIYKLCPFDKTIQQSKANNGETSIGKWDGWDNESNTNKYNIMKFTNGLACWNGPQRSTVVLLSCGLENSLVSVTEPNKCEYEMKFETPAVCAKDNFTEEQVHQEL